MRPEDLLGAFCFLSIGLVFVTVIGHGLWLALAAFFRFLSDSAAPEPGPNARTSSGRCPACGLLVSSTARPCPRCGHVSSAARSSARDDDRAAAIRELTRLCQAGAISDVRHAELLKLLRAGSEAGSGVPAIQPAVRTLAAAPAPESTVVASPAPPRAVRPEPIEAEIVSESPRPRAAAAPPPRPPQPAAVKPHPLDADAPLPAATTAARQTLADFLQAFMAEKNIRWGELVSGLLIVGSAVGLVISLRETLKDTIPYFPALLFMLVTLAIYGAGMYTLQRWNLRGTSRGVLTIALLLAPLNFLAAILLSEGEKREVTDPWYLVAVAVGTLCCGWITFSAGRALLGRGWWRLTAAVLATSGGQLIIDRQSGLGDSLLGTSALVALPVGGYLVAVLSQLQHAITWRRLSERRSVQILLILGVATFALLAPLGLFVAHHESIAESLANLTPRESIAESLANLAPALSLVAAAVLGTGLALHGRVLSRALVGYRTAGTALAVAGGMLMVATVVLAWPQPDLLITVGLANAAILVVVASIGRLPLLHTAACGCLALAYLVAFHLLQGHWGSAEAHPSQRWIELFLMGRSGVALTALAAVIGGLAWRLGLRQRWREAESYWLGAAGLALVSIAIAISAGTGASDDQDLSAPIFALYATVSFGAALWLCSRDHKFSWAAPAITAAGIGLTLAALGQAFWLNETCRGWLANLHLLPPRPVLTATLCTANFAAWWGLFLARRDLDVERAQRPQRRWVGLIYPLLGAALLLATLAMPSALWVREQAFGTHAVFLFAIALVWLIASLIDRQPWALLVFQSVATVAVGFVTAAVCWVPDDTTWLTSSTHLQTQIAVLAAWCLAWNGVRRLFPAGQTGRVAFLAVLGTRAADRAVDELLLGGLLFAAGAHGIAACCPGAMAEVGLEQFSVDSVPHFVCGPAAWIAWTLLFAALVAALCEQFSLLRERRGSAGPIQASDGLFPEDWSLLAALVGVWLALAILPLLVSAPWTSVCATASALRWSFSFYGIVMSAVIWFRRSVCSAITAMAGGACGVRPLGPAGASLHSAASHPDSLSRGSYQREATLAPPPGTTTATVLRETGLWIGVLPALVLTTIMVVRAVEGLPRGTPTDALFGSLVQTNLGKMVSFGVPLMIVVGVLLGHAMREGLLGYALLSSVIFQYSLTLAHALNTKPNQPSFAAESLQWNATGLAAFTLLWLGLHRWLRPREGRTRAEAWEAAGGSAEASLPRPSSSRAAEIPLLVQITATVLAIAALAVWSALAIFFTPGGLTDHQQPLGGLLSYVAWGLSLGAAVWLVRRHPQRVEARAAESYQPDLPQVLASFALALIALLAATLDRLDVSHTWLAYHVLTLGWLILAAGLVALACRGLDLWREANLVGVLVTVLAVRGCLYDPHPWAPWWSIAAAAGTAVLAAVTAFRRRRQSFAYASVVLTVLATSFYWFGPWLGRWGRVDFQSVLDLWMAGLTAATWAAGLWLGVELWFQSTSAEQAFDPKVRAGRVHVVVPLLALVLSTLTMMLVFVCNVFDGGPALTLGPASGLPALIAVGLLLVGAFWDRRAVHAVPGLYVWGVWVVMWVLDRLSLPAETAFFAVGMATAAYVTVTGLIWERGAWWVWVGGRWGVHDPLTGLQRTAHWLPVVNLLGSGLAMLITLIVVLNFEQRWMRISSGFAPALLAVGLGALAQKERRALLQYAALLMTGVAAVYLSWADLAPSWESATWLLRVIRLLIVLSAMTFLYSVIVRRQLGADSPWLESVRRITATFGASALGTLVLVLLIEFSIFHPEQGVPVDPAHSGAVMVVLVGLIVGLFSMAMWPGRDPLALSENGRMLYVYGAELVATLLFVHVYFCVPWLFHGRFRHYWPYIVMAIAFAGVGVGELFQRRGLRVLAEPLTRTGGFLPLLSALGWWVIVAEKTDYSALLFLVGLLYLVLCYYRRSVLSGVAAALAGNGALWRLLYQTDFAFWQHPQMWLIPPAVSALIAGQMNRRRLPPAQLAGIRYASILVIYLSSTSEMFIRGIGESLWPPMILASLAVAGVFLGLVLQVRAFLYLGSSFVFLSVVSMVWHAQRAIQHSWPWWAFGIGLGIGILAVFGVFEKKRPEIMIWMEKLRHWEQ